MSMDLPERRIGSKFIIKEKSNPPVKNLKTPIIGKNPPTFKSKMVKMALLPTLLPGRKD
jgi:hypothetical protein